MFQINSQMNFLNKLKLLVVIHIFIVKFGGLIPKAMQLQSTLSHVWNYRMKSMSNMTLYKAYTYLPKDQTQLALIYSDFWLSVEIMYSLCFRSPKLIFWVKYN